MNQLGSENFVEKSYGIQLNRWVGHAQISNRIVYERCLPQKFPAIRYVKKFNHDSLLGDHTYYCKEWSLLYLPGHFDPAHAPPYAIEVGVYLCKL